MATRRRSWNSIPLLGAFALAVFVSAAGGAWAAGVGDALPEISLVDVTKDSAVDLAGLVAGSPGAIAYMQTSCAACRKELMALKELEEKYPDLKVVAISVDAGNPARVARYREHFAFSFPFLHDPDFRTPELFGFSFTPALVMVDRDGKIAMLKGGFRPGDEAEIEKQVLKLQGQ